MSPAGTPFEHSLESTARALAGDPDLDLMLPGKQHGEHGASVDTPALVEARQAGSIAVMRGRYDAIAMRARFHNSELHCANAPAGPLSRALYDALENVRIEACAAREFEGVAANLAAIFEYQSSECGVNVIESDAATPMTHAIVLLLRARLTGTELGETAARFVARWQDEIVKRSSDEIEALCTAVLRQLEYTRCSRRLITALELIDEPEISAQVKPAETASDELADEVGNDSGNGAGGHNDAEIEASAAAVSANGAVKDDESASKEHGDGKLDAGAASTVIAFPLNSDKGPNSALDDAMEGTPDEPGGAGALASGSLPYRVFTRRFDSVVHARNLLVKEQLLLYRTKLDEQLSAHRRVAVKLANRLQNSLRTLQKRAWTFDLDDGLLDTTHLSRLVVDPTSPLAYKQERDSETHDTVVSFLIDNSGSMRGQPIALAAMFTDIFAQALERCRVATEILGFTTGGWRGGRSRQLWLEHGRPDQPGRLSDLRHIIYKHADEPWRKARTSLGAMLWPALLKENIDGEALLWAHQRLAGRQEQRRILVVISDGVPADDVTLTANSCDYLVTHLHQVADWIETKSSVELLAIGIGHDVDMIYRRSVKIADTDQLGEVMAHELIELLGDVPLAVRHPYAFKTPAGQTT